MGTAKLLTASPPTSAIGSKASSVVNEVNTVLLSVLFTASLIISARERSGLMRSNSLTRSNTTTLSLIEYPIKASSAATAVRLNSIPVKAIKPIVLVKSSSTVSKAAVAKCASN